jgi:hypothetical protein
VGTVGQGTGGYLGVVEMVHRGEYRHMYTGTQLQAQRYTDTKTHKHTHTDTRTHTQTHTQTHRHTDTHTHTHTHTPTHTHTHTNLRLTSLPQEGNQHTPLMPPLPPLPLPLIHFILGGYSGRPGGVGAKRC